MERDVQEGKLHRDAFVAHRLTGMQGTGNVEEGRFTASHSCRLSRAQSDGTLTCTALTRHLRGRWLHARDWMPL